MLTVNKRPLDEYFPSATHRMVITEPMRLVERAEDYDVDSTLDGGGVSGQAGALRLARKEIVRIVDFAGWLVQPAHQQVLPGREPL